MDKIASIFIVILHSSSAFGSSNQNPNAYSSYQGETICNPAHPVEHPSTIEELQLLLQSAIDSNTTVKAFGARHSVLDTICTAGIPIDMHNINYIHLDPSTFQVKVGAGAELSDLTAFLQNNGRALSGHTPSYGGTTVGGVLGTGARGSSLLHPTSLSDQVISLTVLDGLGNLRVIDASNPDYPGFQVHLGLLGVIVDASFNTVAVYKMQIENYPDSDSILFDGTVLELAPKFDWFQLWWFPSSSSVVVSNGSYLENTTPGNASTQMIPDLDAVTVLGLRSAFEAGQALRSQATLDSLQLWTKKSLYQQIPLRSPVFTEDGVTVKNPAVGYVHNLMTNRCTKCAWGYGPDLSIYEQETAFAVDLSNFTAMVNTVANILEQNPTSFPVYGIFIRFAPPSTALMSLEYGRQTVHIEIVTPMRNNPFQTSRAGLAAIQAIEQSLVFNLGGRPHWSMCGLALHTLEMEARNSPNIATFRTLLTKYDPNGVFLNNFGRRIKAIANTLTIDPRVEHCALQGYCFCKVSSDCAFGQRCGKLNGFNVCKDVLPEIGVVNSLSSNVIAFLDSLL